MRLWWSGTRLCFVWDILPRDIGLGYEYPFRACIRRIHLARPSEMSWFWDVRLAHGFCVGPPSTECRVAEAGQMYIFFVFVSSDIPFLFFLSHYLPSPTAYFTFLPLYLCSLSAWMFLSRYTSYHVGNEHGWIPNWSVAMWPSIDKSTELPTGISINLDCRFEPWISQRVAYIGYECKRGTRKIRLDKTRVSILMIVLSLHKEQIFPMTALPVEYSSIKLKPFRRLSSTT